jgi:hypothetical protein
MFFIIVVTFMLIFGYIGTLFNDMEKSEGELGALAWALVGVIVGCGVTTYFGII